MREQKVASKKKLEYPAETEGSRIAAVARKAVSKLSAEQRRELFRRGMARIYGGKCAKEAAVTGH